MTARLELTPSEYVRTLFWRCFDAIVLTSFGSCCLRPSPLRGVDLILSTQHTIHICHCQICWSISEGVGIGGTATISGIARYLAVLAASEVCPNIEMRVQHPESIPTCVSPVSLASVVWEPSYLHISKSLTSKRLWNQEALAHHEMIPESASLQSSTWDLAPCRFYLNCCQILQSKQFEPPIGIFLPCTRA